MVPVFIKKNQVFEFTAFCALFCLKFHSTSIIKQGTKNINHFLAIFKFSACVANTLGVKRLSRAGGWNKAFTAVTYVGVLHVGGFIQAQGSARNSVL